MGVVVRDDGSRWAIVPATELAGEDANGWGGVLLFSPSTASSRIWDLLGGVGSKEMGRLVVEARGSAMGGGGRGASWPWDRRWRLWGLDGRRAMDAGESVGSEEDGATMGCSPSDLAA
ncbi:hypothetical protein ACLOJK_031383 [Asimina triloba]